MRHIMLRRLTALAMGSVVFLLTAPLPAASSGADDTCICTPRANFSSPSAVHTWYATADASGQLTVTLITPVVGMDAQTVQAQIVDPANTVLASATAGYPAGSPSSLTVRAPMTIAATPGVTYRVEVRPLVIHFGARYWMRVDGAGDLATDSGLSNIEGGRMTWLVNVDATDSLGMRIHTNGVPLIDAAPGTYPVMFQWIAPNGAEEPVGQFTVTQTATIPIDAVIPPPAGLMSGTWRLRLQTLSFTAPGFDYRLEKTTGIDTMLHLEHGSAGRGLGQVRFVDEHGDPYLGTVDFTFGFGESFTFPLNGGFSDSNPGDVFPIPIAFAPQDTSLVATPASSYFHALCDGLFDLVVVIAPPPPVPPSISLVVSPNTIWPPNHKMVTVTAAINAASPAGHATSVSLVSITNNESGSGDVAGAAFGTDDRTFQVRATRAGSGQGRIYTITYRATDTVTGASTLASATVAVPHDQGK